ncbi:MAG: hypothetical protein EOO62_20655 [Hymenobacter sp.]|nr:MAG: hypothetical protein EOO62_20655 [Hymenobacter sp.]
MPRILTWLILLGALVASRSLRAQVLPVATLVHHHHCCCCSCCHRDTTAATELNNRTLGLLGATIATGQAGTMYGGELEIGRAVAHRLTIGGRAVLTARRASATNYGYDATAPATNYYSLAFSTRYQLLNARHWRLEALGGLGLGAVDLVDRDQQVPNTGRYASTTHPASVAVGLHPLLEAGAGITYKLRRDFWLSSRLGYAYLPGTGALGEAGEFSHWQATVAVVVPWGRHPAAVAAAPESAR